LNLPVAPHGFKESGASFVWAKIFVWAWMLVIMVAAVVMALYSVP